MPFSREAESTLTNRYQTTVPAAVRCALRLGKHDKIHYEIRPNGEVILTRATPTEEDPVIGRFLDFLASNASIGFAHIERIDTELVQRARELTAGVEFDVNTPLSSNDE